MKKYYIASLILILLLAIVPVVLFLLANFITGFVGCPLIEADNYTHDYSCVIFSHDYGEALSAIGRAWPATFTLILATFAFILWGIALAIHLLIRRHLRARGERQA
jgi:uncharacterized membrane protein